MLWRLSFVLLVAGMLAPVGRAASSGPVFSLRAEGNKHEMAELLGVTRQALYNWLNPDKSGRAPRANCS